MDEDQHLVGIAYEINRDLRLLTYVYILKCAVDVSQVGYFIDIELRQHITSLACHNHSLRNIVQYAVLLRTNS